MVNPISYESKGKERKDLIIKHTTTTHSKPVIFVVISLLAVALIYSSSASYVFAAKPAYCFEHSCPIRSCTNNPANGTASCCWEEPGVIPPENRCQTCHVNTDTGEFENCSEPASKHKPDTRTIAPPPSGVAPPPSTQTCPDNTALDARVTVLL